MACGADFTIADGLGRMALHEIAKLGTDAMELGNFCLSFLSSKDTKNILNALNSVASADHNERKVSLAEIIVYTNAWYILPKLVELGLDVHWTPDEEQRGRLLLDAVRAVTAHWCTAYSWKWQISLMIVGCEGVNF